MGRTVNILDNDQTTVTAVEFVDKDDDRFTIEHSHNDYLKLVAGENDVELCFARTDIDKLIKLFEAAKQYNI